MAFDRKREGSKLGDGYRNSSKALSGKGNHEREDRALERIF